MPIYLAAIVTIVFPLQSTLAASLNPTSDGYPYFTNKPQFKCFERVKTSPGETVKLRCDAGGTPKPSIVWRKQGQPIVRTVSYSGWSMVLQDYGPSDEGLYECEVCNERGCVNFSYFVSDQVVFRKVALVDSRYTLPCDGIGNVTWSKNFHPPECFASVLDSRSAGSGLDSYSSAGSISFERITYADAGIYGCTNGLERRLFHLLVVNNRNETISYRSDRLVFKKSGDTVALRCAWKNSKVLWMKNGQVLGFAGSSLEMRNLARDDGGLYRCEICFYSECKQYHFVLVVDSIFTENSMRNETIGSGDYVRFDCETSFADYNVDYRIDYIQYHAVSEHESTIPSNVTKLVVKEFAKTRVNPDTWYTCVVTSCYGVHYKSAFIRSTRAGEPRFRVVTDVAEYFAQEEGCTVHVNCSVEGEPRPNMTWTKDGELLEDNSDVLVISNAARNDTGEYTCEACNVLGCTRRRQWIMVGHLFESTEQNLTVVTNSETKLACLDKYYPFIQKIDWRKVGSADKALLVTSLRYVKHSIGLRFRQIKLSDSGTYLCQVHLHTGDYYERTIHLEVTNDSTSLESSNALTLTLTVSVLSTCLILLAIIFCKNVIQQKLTRSTTSIKKVVVLEQLIDNSAYECSDAVQIPVVRIEQHRSKATRRRSNKHSIDYEFPVDSKWELPRSSLVLGEELGEGAFGKVVRAEASGIWAYERSTTVAVKMLKEGFTDSDVKDFVCELQIMKSIGQHPNIINLLGCCCADGPLYVVVEYAPHGNLKNFLREHEPSLNETSSLSDLQLITFALQIARGMEHLAARKCIHRDPAARNVLVGAGYVMKIADFGLARDILDYEYYRKMTPGKLPVRWMAPESLEHRFYNSQSDVWSFGVLLWEVMSFGGYPYADWDGFLDQLKHGKRLNRPARCPKPVYQLMNHCWMYEADERPSFGEIVRNLERMICGDESFQLDADQD